MVQTIVELWKTTGSMKRRKPSIVPAARRTKMGNDQARSVELWSSNWTCGAHGIKMFFFYFQVAITPLWPTKDTPGCIQVPPPPFWLASDRPPSLIHLEINFVIIK